jgi:restriction system protein
MIPKYQEIMLPVLEVLKDKEEHSMQDLTQQISNKFNLSDEERSELQSVGSQTIIYNRTAWAITYLKRAKLVDSPKRGISIISETGLELLKSNPQQIDLKFLKTIPEYNQGGNNEISTQQDDTEQTKTPEELLADSLSIFKEELVTEIIEQIKECSPKFFERLAVNLFRKMGYEGDETGKSGDEGIDGVFYEDKLRLNPVCIQAKKWESTVGRPEIHKFVGALAGKDAKKGVFITTSDFTKEAKEYQPSSAKVILINGKKLAELMIKYNVGIVPKATYEIKKIDSSYFEEN